MASVGYSWKNEGKEGFVRVNSSNTRTELRRLRWDAFAEISLVKMV